MPTALYLSRERKATIGQAGIDRYLDQNAGRRVVLEREHVGTIEITVADTDQSKLEVVGGSDGLNLRAHVHAWTDSTLPGRLFRGVKRWLGAASLDHVQVFGRHYRIVALITPVLVHLARAVPARAGWAAPVYIGRPVHYEGGSANADQVAVRRMLEACGHAELRPLTLYPEPVAAARAYLHQPGCREAELLIAFDFGGGTLDLSLVRARSGRFEVLATHGTSLGGDEINREIYRRWVFPELGEGLDQSIVIDERRKRTRFPFDRFADRLLNWALAYELNQPELCEVIAHGMREGPDARRRLGRLLDLITQNRAYAVFQAIERCKVTLSSQPHARIELEELDLDVPLTRADLEGLIEPMLDRIDRCLEVLLERGGVAENAVDVVVRTGGSSQIPAVIHRLNQRFPGRILEHAPFTSIAAGLALASFHQHPAPETRTA